VASLPFAFVRLLGGSSLLATVSGIFVFGSDFSFVPGILLANEGFPWTLYFATTIWSLFTLNGYIPATIALFSCLLTLRLYLEKGRTLYLAIFAACVIGAFGFKASMGLQMAAATLATGAAWFYLDRPDRRGRDFFLTGVLLSSLLLFLSLRVKAGTNSIEATLAPFNLLDQSIQYLEIDSLDIVWFPFVMALFLLGGLGVRTLGIWGIFTQLKVRTSLRWMALFFLFFFVGGYFLSEFLYVGKPGGLNNAIWFYVQALMATWFALFAFLAERSFAGRGGSILLLGLVVLAAPTTIQFLSQRSVPAYRLFGSDEVAVIEFLRTTDPGSVVLHPLNPDRPSLASNFAGRSSVLNRFSAFVSEGEGLSGRIKDIDCAFALDSSQEQRMEVLQKYSVDYVLVPTAMSDRLSSIPGMELGLQTHSASVYRYENVESRGQAQRLYSGRGSAPAAAGCVR
jgi:hypothetical protein